MDAVGRLDDARDDMELLLGHVPTRCADVRAVDTS
jgi:hypothetical protein